LEGFFYSEELSDELYLCFLFLCLLLVLDFESSSLESLEESELELELDDYSELEELDKELL
jgi:hypothetical protein